MKTLYLNTREKVHLIKFLSGYSNRDLFKIQGQGYHELLQPQRLIKWDVLRYCLIGTVGAFYEGTFFFAG